MLGTHSQKRCLIDSDRSLGNRDATMGWGCRKSFSRGGKTGFGVLWGAANFNKAVNGQKPETHLSVAGAISTES